VETKLHTLLTALKVLMLKAITPIVKTRTTSNGRPTICVSSANKRKTQVGWAVAIGQR